MEAKGRGCFVFVGGSRGSIPVLPKKACRSREAPFSAGIKNIIYSRSSEVSFLNTFSRIR
jgi:hypothetical protein